MVITSHRVLCAGNVFTINDIEKLTKPTKQFSPSMDEKTRQQMYNGWNNAVKNILH